MAETLGEVCGLLIILWNGFLEHPDLWTPSIEIRASIKEAHPSILALNSSARPTVQNSPHPGMHRTKPESPQSHLYLFVSSALAIARRTAPPGPSALAFSADSTAAFRVGWAAQPRTQPPREALFYEVVRLGGLFRGSQCRHCVLKRSQSAPRQA
ncbi:unnamed protein product [Protopolystoma xenopodis]|uniref:Uncharacterized protein n=1 Tax=Protopolystoma xenopodis TaxID=117903 RepID=A0A448XE52_9PLAT|nr:unnamed protein product [Protopolystoma xenopodis]